MIGGQKNLPTFVVIKLTLIFLNETDCLKNKTFTRFHTVNSVKVKNYPGVFSKTE